MIVIIGDFECTEVWDGVFYKKLSNYPFISDWEARTIIEFIEYEKKYGRECTIECENMNVLKVLHEKILNKDNYIDASRPKLIIECTACPYRKWCEKEFVCHTTSIENAIKIFDSGKLFSAINARKIPVEQLIQEKRNAANDPADYFEYVMFSWGNCQAGDRLVMERKLGRFPNEKDLSEDFNPGIRFYFKYDELISHPDVIFEGVLPMKVKDELVLKDWLYVLVIPADFKHLLEDLIPLELLEKVLFIDNDCVDIWDWSEKVYTIVENYGK